jgi:hypothetical protein
MWPGTQEGREPYVLHAYGFVLHKFRQNKNCVSECYSLVFVNQTDVCGGSGESTVESYYFVFG